MEKNLIIGTAGHIDHGKTTLIKALTGKDTDRLKEEKKRGISIELGFSCLELSDGLQVGIIDVPGHEKFIKNMLAGAGGVDLALLVVAADEEIMAQTKEHLAILSLLNVKYGIVAVTKSDLVEDEWLELVIEEIKEEFEGTFLEEASIVPVSAIEGRGIEQLKKEIEQMVRKIPAKDDQGNVYFPIDRVFSITGYGTIVTGTLINGRVEVEDTLKVYPGEIDARVRSLQVHEKDVQRALPGQRVGINLAGVDTDDIERGDVLATSGSLSRTNYLDARLKLLEAAPMVLQHGDRIRLHLGAKEVLGRVYLLDKEEVYPGEEGLVQFNLEEEVVANFKERYILRRYSPMTTIGGGEILDTKPRRHKKFDKQVIEALTIKNKGTLEQRVELSLRLNNKKASKVNELIKGSNLAAKQLLKVLEELKEAGKVVEFEVGKESSWIHANYYQQLRVEMINYLEKYHKIYHLRLGMAKEELRTKLFMKLNTNEYNLLVKDLVTEGDLVSKDAQLSLAEFKLEFTPIEQDIKEKVIKQYRNDKFAPPTIDKLLETFEDKNLAQKVVDLLIETKDLIEVNEELSFIPEAIEEARAILVDYLKKEGEIELGDYRDLLNSSRKYTLALLNYFDQQRITKRKENKRILANANKVI